MPIPFRLDYVIERLTGPQQTDVQRTLKSLAGVKLSAPEARELLPRIREHKWYLSERLGRDVGWRVAAVDYFENIQLPRPVPSSYRTVQDTLPPRLPMMQTWGERVNS